MIEISEDERKKRDLQSALDGISREISNTRFSINSIEYGMDLLDSHRIELNRRLEELTRKREVILERGLA